MMLLTYWKPILAVALLVSVWAWHQGKVNEAWNDGRAALLAEQAEDAKRRQSDAQEADAAARRCAASDTCRMQNDGFRRD